ncbi:SpoIIE family protein phosphatase [bacterium]|nr:SpoIIE family protein phosphatase [bacterium]
MGLLESSPKNGGSARRHARTRWMYLFAALCTLGLCLFAAVDAGKMRPNDGTVWLLGRPEVTVLEVPPRSDGTLSRLEPGDVILGIGNTMIESPQDAANILGRQRTGTTIQYLVKRGEEIRSLPVSLAGFRTAGRFYAYYGVLALAYWVIGLLVFMRGSEQQAARLFFRMCLLFAIFFMTNLDRSSYFWGDIITQNAGAMARFFLPAIFLHFFLVFPEKRIYLTRFPWLEPTLYLLPLVFYIQFTIDQFFGSHAPRIYNTRWLILGTYFSAGVLALIQSYLRFRDPLQRQRIRILTIGTLSGVLPFLAFTVLPGGHVGDNIAFLGTVPMIAVPLSFGYSIARYQVMKIEVLLKRSLVYTMLTTGVYILYVGLLLGLGALLLRLSGQTSQFAAVTATLAAAAVLWPARLQVQGSLDRRFFRSRQNLAGALQEFSQEITQIIQQEELIERIGGRLCILLDIPKLAVYRPAVVSEVMVWRLAGAARSVSYADASGADDRTPPCPEEFQLTATAKRLEQFNEPYWIERRGASLGMRAAATREQAELLQRLQERDALADAGMALLVPMLVHGRLVGIIALPPKRGGDEFQLQDLELLSMVAGQVALQMENTRLYEEELKKQKLEEQLGLARTIQSRLLPRQIPEIPGLDLAACNITSAEVSGDYYDLIKRQDGRLVIIISDVSGKGVPASLLASSLQASMRAHCQTSCSPGEILERVNLYLHESTDPSHFATLFLAIFDPQTNTLCYSSGGHNSPVLRRTDGSIELLEKGGLPLGAFDFGTYEEESVTLAPGDTLFMYTDGLTETRNGAEEEFGEERVERLLGNSHELPAARLLDVMHDELRLFSGRAVADDDVTLVALKVQQSAQSNLTGPVAYEGSG